jgi:hypothetical protein
MASAERDAGIGRLRSLMSQRRFYFVDQSGASDREQMIAAVASALALCQAACECGKSALRNAARSLDVDTQFFSGVPSPVRGNEKPCSK